MEAANKPLVYPADYEVKVVSSSGHVAHGGKYYHHGEAFADKRVGLRLNREGQTDLHFANVHLGNLTYDSGGRRFRPPAYVARPKPDPTGTPSNVPRQKHIKRGSYVPRWGGAAPPLPTPLSPIPLESLSKPSDRSGASLPLLSPSKTMKTI